MKISLRCNGKTNPLGIDESKVVLSASTVSGNIQEKILYYEYLLYRTENDVKENNPFYVKNQRTTNIADLALRYLRNGIFLESRSPLLKKNLFIRNELF